MWIQVKFVTRMWTTDYPLSHENAVSFREHTQTCISMMFLLLQWPSLHSGKCHCRFHRAIRNWSQVRNEQLASPTLGMHLWHNELRPSDNDDHDDYDHVDKELRDGVFRGAEVVWALVPKAREREGVISSCWYFS